MCDKCPRLRNHCLNVAQEKRKSYAQETYWGRPVSGFGDPDAQLVVIGLAPAAHGANRTGRIFTGDRSGDWLYRALYKSGFANQAKSLNRNDGLELRNAWVTCTVRCAPPDNKPTRNEFENCKSFLHEEVELHENARVYLALGGVALSVLEKFLREKNLVTEKRKWKFAHDAEFTLNDGRTVIASYHPSQQNTFTKRLTELMLDSVFSKASKKLSVPISDQQ